MKIVSRAAPMGALRTQHTEEAGIPMARWRVHVRALSLRTKVGITLGAAAIALLGISTFVSFRYWKSEALVIAEQQALLAGGSVRGSLEAALAADQPAQVRRLLRQLVERGVIERARVYSADGRILVSSDPSEEGAHARTEWLPARELLRTDGVARFDPRTERVDAFLPLRRPDATLLQVSFPVGPVRAAMDRGLKVGFVLILLSILVVGGVLATMLEREVVAPMRRVSGLLGGPEGERGPRVELGGIAASVERLIAQQRAVDALAKEQQRQIEAQAGLAQVGGLAAEMAHEFKRPLTSIRTGLEVIDQEYLLDPRGEEMLHVLRDQLERLSETMRDLFAIAKPIEFEHRAVDLREVLDGALMLMAGHPAMQGVEVRRLYESEVLVHGDSHRLEQVATNLVLNAAEAMPHGGTLEVRLLTHDGCAVFEVADTGVGIPPEAVNEVFRPFYSTKPTGTGLGLALTARIVAAHAGEVKVDSTEGEGTTIRVELPLAHLAAGVINREAYHG
jgi:signal transduction histidine kinase